jgi:hypothetical protein
MNVTHQTIGVNAATPNDNKLSDRRSGRGLCRWMVRWRGLEAQAVTAEPVRWSAWLGELGSAVKFMLLTVGDNQSKRTLSNFFGCLKMSEDGCGCVPGNLGIGGE